MVHLFAREFSTTQAARVAGIRSGFSESDTLLGTLAPWLIGGAFVLFFLLVFLMSQREKKSTRSGRN